MTDLQEVRFFCSSISLERVLPQISEVERIAVDDSFLLNYRNGAQSWLARRTSARVCSIMPIDCIKLRRYALNAQ